MAKDDLTGLNSESEPCLWRIKMGPDSKIEKPKRRICWLDVLIGLFGIGAWVGVNGMYVQLPLLVNSAPEGWRLPNLMVVVIQLANVGPLGYSFLRKIAPHINDSIYINIVLILGTIAAFLMAFLYNVTTIIGGEERSTVFLVLVFFVALVGCTSSVLFYPFMRHYRDIYLVSYMIGEGLSGFLPSIVAIIQGVGGDPDCVIENNNTTLVYKDPRFGITPFLLFVSALMCSSLFSFVFLNITKRFDSEKVQQDDKRTLEQGDKNIPEVSLTSTRNITLLCLMATVCAFGNGIYPSIQSFSCLPYGNTAYHLAVTLSSMANPMACFLAVFLPKTSNFALATLSNLSALISAYILATALLSPVPPLRGYLIGEVIVVMSWIAAVALVSYIKLCIATVFRGLGANAMFVCGAVSQAGSAAGSLLLYILLNYTPSLFTTSDPCL